MGEWRTGEVRGRDRVAVRQSACSSLSSLLLTPPFAGLLPNRHVCVCVCVCVCVRAYVCVYQISFLIGLQVIGEIRTLFAAEVRACVRTACVYLQIIDR